MSKTAENVPSTAVRPNRYKPAGRWIRDYAQPTAGLFLLLMGAAGFQSILEGDLSLGSISMLGLGLGCILWIGLKVRYRAARNFLASAKAAIMLSVALAIYTVLGTLIVQSLSIEGFYEHYGDFASGLIALQLNDIFHSLPFGLVLGLLALTSVVTVVVRRRSLRKWRHSGVLMTHLAVVCIILGAFVGSLAGFKGMMHLQVGESSRFVDGQPDPGERVGERLKLDFQVRLDRFELDHYEPEYRLYTYEKKSENEWDVVKSDEPKVGAEVGAPGDEHLKLKITRYFKNLKVVRAWVPDEDAGPNTRPKPAARLTISGGPGRAVDTWLAPMSGHGGFRDPHGKFEVHLRWDAPSPTELSGMGAGSGGPAKHMLEANGKSREVRVGQEYAIGGGAKLKVRQFLPDFQMDLETRRARSRSDRPVNPALVIDIERGGKTQRHFLFGREDMRRAMAGGNHSDAGLTYAYVGSRSGPERSLLFVASTKELLEVVKGEVVSRQAVEWGQPTKLPGAPEGVTIALDQLVRVARAETTYLDAPGAAPNPAVQLSIAHGSDPAQTMMLSVGASRPLPLGENRFLVFKERSDKIRNFASTVTVLDANGEAVAKQTVRVNEPMSFGGYDFYQSNYDPKNPSYSGLQVVGDPGLLFVNIGLWLLMLAVIQTILLRHWTPWWQRRGRRRPADKARASAEQKEMPA